MCHAFASNPHPGQLGRHLENHRKLFSIPIERIEDPRIKDLYEDIHLKLLEQEGISFKCNSNVGVNINIADYAHFSEKYQGEKGELDCFS